MYKGGSARIEQRIAEAEGKLEALSRLK